MKLDTEKVKLLMMKQCLSQAELAEHADLGKTTLYRMLEGKAPQLKSIGKLAAALGVEPQEIIKKEEE